MKKLVLSLVILIAAVATVKAEPVNPNLYPADIKWAVHVDVQGFNQSTIRSLIWKAIQAEGKAELIQNQMVVLKNMIGFNPMEELDSIGLYNNSLAPREGVVFLTGKFNSQKIYDLLAADETHAVTQYGSFSIHKWFDKKEQRDSYGTMFNESMIIISNSAEKVQNAIDTVAGQNGNLADTIMPNTIRETPAGTFFIASVTGLDEINLPKKAQMMQNVVDMGVIAGESDGKLFFRASLTTKSPETAIQIKQIIDGVIAFVLMNQDTQPELASLVRAVQVKNDDVLVDVSFSYSSEQLLATLKKVHAAKINAPNQPADDGNQQN